MIAQLICVAAASLLAAWGLHRMATLLAAVQAARRPRLPTPASLGDDVAVTVQVPLYNEPDVCVRAVDAACALRWPALQVQILDDSTDDTSARVAAAVARWRSRGVDVAQLRRDARTGFKAGALAAGLSRARGELIAIFDADFVPPADFLERAVPLLAAHDMVQARWDHLNRDESAWTRAQAALLDAHFAVEQLGRSHRARFFGFNGTAGVWRRSAIESAGGWSASTLTEDLDLSVRAWLAGARFVYLDALAAPAELPADIAACRVQQQRWAKGAMQTARMRLPLVWRSRLPFIDKLDLTLKLGQGLCWPLLAAVVLALPIAALESAAGGRGELSSFASHTSLTLMTLAPLVAIAGAGLGTAPALAAVAWASHRRGSSWARACVDAVLALGLAAALSLHVARASLAGLLNMGDRTFHRTAKTGRSGVRSRFSAGSAISSVALEGAVGVLHLGSAAMLTMTGHALVTPFLWLCGVSLVALAARSLGSARIMGRLPAQTVASVPSARSVQT